MKALTKYLAGAATVAALTVSAASPASAQYYDPYRNNNNGIGTGEIIAGVAVLGGIAAIVAAMSNDGNRYGYENRYQYRDNYTNAVNACGYEAERYGRGAQVSITDIDRRSNSSYRVRGVINAGYATNDRYGAYNGYATNDRYGRYDPYGRYGNNSGYGNNGRYGNYYGQQYGQQASFACTARADGRVTDFDIDRRY